MLKAEVMTVLSNHTDYQGPARTSGIEFHCLPLTLATKDARVGRLGPLSDER